MVMSTRIGVGDSTISESRTIPLPENSTARPLRKPVPLTSRVFLTGLRSANTMFGLTDDTVGGGVTRRHPVHVAFEPAGSVYVRSRGPVGASAATETSRTSSVADFTAADLIATPLPENDV